MASKMLNCAFVRCVGAPKAEVYHQYTKLRKDFGRHCSFSDQEAAEVVLDVKPWEQLQQKFAARNPVNTTVQISPTYAEHEANTNKVVTQSTAMAHIEGGWPKDIDPSDPEQVIRYRKKVERDEQYIRRVASLGSAVEDLVKENNAIDIYEEYFQGLVFPCFFLPCLQCLLLFLLF